MANPVAFIDQLQGASYQSLSSQNFQVGIIDPDDAQLTSSQISNLQASGKSLIAYLSVGEAENYRSYWNASWNSSPPSFLMGQNPDWPGDYNVKFWDPNWQQLVINQAVSMAKAGYHGVMLDVVDAYSVPAVAAAAGGIDAARADMAHFVEAISAATKAVNSNFKIIQNNALDMLTTNPDDPSSATNASYVSHIDGVLAESTFYNPDNSQTSWGSWNAQYLQHAVAAGKTVLSIDYPTDPAAQQSYIKQAVADGFVPYVADQSLDGTVASVNSQIPGALHAGALNALAGAVSAVGSTVGSIVGSVTSSLPGVTPTAPSTHSSAPAPASPPAVAAVDTTHHVVNVANGTTTQEGSQTNMAFAFGPQFHGHTTVNYFATDSGDVLNFSPSIFPSVTKALNHVSYAGNDATLHLGNGHGSVTLTGVGPHSLTAEDFHIG